MGWALGLPVVLIGGGTWFVGQALGSGTCEKTVYSEADASDGSVARIQMADCGATTGFSRVVMVEEPGIWPQECRAFAANGEPGVSITWSGNSLLVTHNAPSSDVIAVASNCFGHQIEVKQEA